MPLPPFYFWLVVFLGVLASFSCSSTPKGEERGRQYFETGLAASQGNRLAEARSRWQSSCEWKSAAACEIVGRSLAKPLSRLPILQGATDANSTQILVQHPQKQTLQFHLFERESLRWLAPRDMQRRNFQSSSTQLSWLRFRQLRPNVDYLFLVTDENFELIDSRTLRAIDTAATKQKFAVVSCMDDGFEKEQREMWVQLLSHKPDFLLFLGDNVYADKRVSLSGGATPPPAMWQRYAQTREALEVYRSPRLTPIFATWDDHDFGMNDGGAFNPFRSGATDVFTRFFAQEVTQGFLDRGPGVSSSFDLAGMRFVLMDDRSFRDSQSHFGMEQQQWLLRELRRRPMPTFIASGDQFFGGYHKFESFEGSHPADFAKFLQELRSVPSPVVFLSGDRHLAELMEIPASTLGYRTYEFTSSAIHAKTYPNAWQRVPNKRQIAGAAGSLNYGIVETMLVKSNWSLTFAAFGPAKQLLFRKEATIQK